MTKQELDKLFDVIEDFYDFADCECWDCKHSSNSHGVNMDKTKDNLKKHIYQYMGVTSEEYAIEI